MLASDPIEVPTFEREEHCCPLCCSNSVLTFLSFKHEHRSAGPDPKHTDWISHADT